MAKKGCKEFTRFIRNAAPEKGCKTGFAAESEDGEKEREEKLRFRQWVEVGSPKSFEQWVSENFTCEMCSRFNRERRSSRIGEDRDLWEYGMFCGGEERYSDCACAEYDGSDTEGEYEKYVETFQTPEARRNRAGAWLVMSVCEFLGGGGRPFDEVLREAVVDGMDLDPELRDGFATSMSAERERNIIALPEGLRNVKRSWYVMTDCLKVLALRRDELQKVVFQTEVEAESFIYDAKAIIKDFEDQLAAARES